MKLSKRQLKRIIREEKRRLTETGDIFSRPQSPMVANTGAQMHRRRIDSIADELILEGMSEDKAVEVATMILERLKMEGLI